MRFTVWFIVKGKHLKRKLTCSTKNKLFCDKKDKYFAWKTLLYGQKWQYYRNDDVINRKRCKM